MAERTLDIIIRAQDEATATLQNVGRAGVQAGEQIQAGMGGIGEAATKAAQQASSAFSSVAETGTVAARDVDEAWNQLRIGGGFGAEADAAFAPAAAAGVGAAEEVSAAWKDVGAGAGSGLAAGIERATETAVAAATTGAAEVTVAWKEAGAGAGEGIAASVEAGSAKAAEAGTAAAATVGEAWGAAKGTISGLFTGAIAIGGLDLLTKGAVGYGHQIQQLTSAYGINAQTAARLKATTDLVGVSITSVIPTIARLTKAAADSSSSTSKALAAYGINVQQFRSADISGQLEILSDAYVRAGDKGKQFLADVLGGRGTKLAPLLAEYGELQQKVGDIHFPIPSREDILAMEQFQLEMQRLVTTVEVKVVPIILKFKTAIELALGAWAFTKIIRGLSSINTAIDGVLVKTGLLTAANTEAAVATESLAVAEGEAAAGAGGMAAGETAAAAAGGVLAGSITAVLGKLGLLAAAWFTVNEASKLWNAQQDINAANASGRHQQYSEFANDLGLTAIKTGDLTDEQVKMIRQLEDLKGTALESKGGLAILAEAQDTLDRRVREGRISWATYSKIVGETGLTLDVTKDQAGKTTGAILGNAAATRNATDAYEGWTAAQGKWAKGSPFVAEVLQRTNEFLGTEATKLSEAKAAWTDWRTSTAQSLNFVTGSLSSFVTANSVNLDKMSASLDKQLAGMKRFGDNLDTIARDGTKGAQELVRQLLQAGEGGQHFADVFAHASADVRQHIENDIGRSFELAQRQAGSLEASIRKGMRAVATAVQSVHNDLQQFIRDFERINGLDVTPRIDLIYTTHYQTVGSPPPGTPAGIHAPQIGAAMGYHGMVNEPTWIHVAEGGKAERVDIGPAGSYSGDSGGGTKLAVDINLDRRRFLQAQDLELRFGGPA